jgi:hypothetical protein
LDYALGLLPSASFHIFPSLLFVITLWSGVCSVQSLDVVDNFVPLMTQRNFGNNLEPEIQQHNVSKIEVCLSEDTHCFIIAIGEGLMLFRETVAVYCENHTEHTNTLCGQNAEL